MYGHMEAALNLIRDKLAKAEAKAVRAEKAWELAKNEASDLHTALRVMSELTGESVGAAPPTSSAAMVARQQLIVQLLPVGEAKAVPPAELYNTYNLLGDEQIGIDTFRTTVWRMRDSDFAHGPDRWLVKGDNGRYWKEPGTFETRMRHEEALRAAAAQSAPIVNFDDDDERPPF